MVDRWTLGISILCSLQLTSAKPNFVIFLVDDLGIADLGCFGNDTIKTPNIDRLAASGTRLQQHVTPDSICTPNRAALLTGRYPIRSGLASQDGEVRVFIFTAASGGLPQNETTFAEVVANAGYKTGMVGKWHLGLHSSSSSDFHFHPLKHGFQYFYGLPLTNLRDCEPGQFVVELIIPGLTPTNLVFACVVLALTLFMCYLTGLLSRFTVAFFIAIIVIVSFAISSILTMLASLNCFVMRNYVVVEQATILENLTMKFTDEAVNFIRANKNSPFLLYMSYAKVHTALFTTPPFANHSSHGRYGDNVEEMDWSVGQIMSSIDEMGLKDNTFVYFSSDNGPHLEEIHPSGEYHGGWKGVYRGGKGQAWDGGVRVPTIVSWPNHIPAGITINQPTTSMDLWPTIAKLTEQDIPSNRIIDGKDLFPLLTNQTQLSPHNFIFHYCGTNVHAVRHQTKNGSKVWKAHFMTAKWTEGTEACIGEAVCSCYGKYVNIHEPPLLYDITNDPAELQPIATDLPEYKEVLREIHGALQKHKHGVSKVPGQLGKNIFHPWLQICCNYPICSCKESDRNLQHYPKHTRN